MRSILGSPFEPWKPACIYKNHHGFMRDVNLPSSEHTKTARDVAQGLLPGKL